MILRGVCPLALFNAAEVSIAIVLNHLNNKYTFSNVTNLRICRKLLLVGYLRCP